MNDNTINLIKQLTFDDPKEKLRLLMACIDQLTKELNDSGRYAPTYDYSYFISSLEDHIAVLHILLNAKRDNSYYISTERTSHITQKQLDNITISDIDDYPRWDNWGDYSNDSQMIIDDHMWRYHHEY